MAKFTDWLLARPVVDSTAVPGRQRFSAQTSIGSDWQTFQALVTNNYSAGKVTRQQCMRVPALKAARDKIAGLGQLPIHAINAKGDRVDSPFLEQPESMRGRVRSVTMTRTIEDLFYDSYSLWLVATRYSNGFPASVEHIQFGRWTQDPETGVIRVKGKEMRSEDCILFESPNDPILHAAAPTVRMILRLEAMAELYSESPEAAEYFTADQGQDLDDDQVTEFLDSWVQARKARTSAYIPPGILRHETKRMTAQELQLIDAREFCVKEISRLTNIDADWLAVVTTSRSYQNLQDARRHFIDHTASPYLRAVEERLGLPDVTPRGTYVRWSLDAYLRANTLERFQAHKLALDGGWETLNEIRGLENRPPLEDSDE